jgi:hypothetical protein
LAQADVFAGQKRDADRLERAPDRSGDSRQGARRSASKSSIALALTEAADASFATDQPSRARAERHWAAEIIALGRAGKVGRRAIAITASVSRCPHNKFRLDRISRAICQSTNKGIINPLCAVAPASGAPDHAPRATLEINDQLGARAESPESLRRTAHPKPVTRAKFTRVLTRRWREADSNLRSLSRIGPSRVSGA